MALIEGSWRQAAWHGMRRPLPLPAVWAHGGSRQTMPRMRASGSSRFLFQPAEKGFSWLTHRCPSHSSTLLQRRKRQLKAREAGKVEAAHVSAGGAVLGLIAGVGEAAAMTKVRL